MENFDDLFNDFFNNGSPKRKRKKTSDSSKKEESPDNLNGIRDLMDLLSNLDSSVDLEEKLGPPTSVSRFIDKDGVEFEEKKWDTKDGVVTRTHMVSYETPESEYYRQHNSDDVATIKKQLKKAIDNENYELAAKLRDQLNNLDKK
jgi:hypothetical protein